MNRRNRRAGIAAGSHGVDWPLSVAIRTHRQNAFRGWRPPTEIS